ELDPHSAPHSCFVCAFHLRCVYPCKRLGQTHTHAHARTSTTQSGIIYSCHRFTPRRVPFLRHGCVPLDGRKQREDVGGSTQNAAELHTVTPTAPTHVLGG
ncbi:unnamed protein product, partial [Ectocarpus sp. 12 AP-2014]